MPNLFRRVHSNFLNSETGGLTIFSIFLFIMLLMISGMAVDLIRTERERVAVQNVGDTAVLAAARLDSDIDPSVLIADYFSKAGIPSSVYNLNVQTGTNSRVVTIQSADTVPTIFMGLLGHDELPLFSTSEARESAVEVEISLVLDISSSMWGSNRLPRLKAAVADFAREVIEGDPTLNMGDVAVSIVPYSLTVNPGPIASYFTINGKHSYRDCVWFETSDFTSLSMGNGGAYERYTHMADGSSGYNNGVVDLPMCPDHTISPFMTSQQDIIDAVDALTGWDGTGIDIGAKWGLAMLDPSFQSVVTGLIADGSIDNRLTGRPYAYGQSRKFMIVMSDGENDSQRDLHARMREGPSPFWRDTASGNISVLVNDARPATGAPSTNDTASRWYQRANDQIVGFPDTNGASGSTDWTMVANQMDQMTWPEVFNIVKTTQLYDRYFEMADDQGFLTQQEVNEYNQPIDFNRITETDTNQRLEDICQLATSRGVEVYAISFDPPSTLAEDTLSDCASTPGHFFSVAGLEISSAFASIATQIRSIRLTQ